MKVTSAIMILTIGYLLFCHVSYGSDDHILKLDKSYDFVVRNPYEWALRQFSDGPISGVGVSDYAHSVLKHGLKHAFADLNGDGIQDLLIRQNSSGRVWEVLVFSPVEGGYRYLGHFPASIIMPAVNESSVLVYEAIGGKHGHIQMYRHDGQKFVGTFVDSFSSGDGYDEGSQKMLRTFPREKRMKWLMMSNDLVPAERAAAIIR